MGRPRGKTPPAKLGRLLRRIRVDAGESLKSAAPKLDVDYSYLSKLENGLVAPSATFLARIAAEYGTDVDTLFLSAGRLPPDIEEIVRAKPEEVMNLIRSHFSE